LAYFHRHHSSNTRVAECVEAWFRTVISALLIMGTYADHRFVLNHMIRCVGLH
jgi:hypothetical protein